MKNFLVLVVPPNLFCLALHMWAPHVGSAAQQAGRGEKTKSCQTYYVPLFIYILAKRLICKCFWVLRFEFWVLPRLFCPVRLIPLFGFNLTAWVGIVTHVHCASQRVLAARQAGIFCGIGYQYNILEYPWKLQSIWLFVCYQKASASHKDTSQPQHSAINFRLSNLLTLSAPQSGAL